MPNKQTTNIDQDNTEEDMIDEDEEDENCYNNNKL